MLLQNIRARIGARLNGDSEAGFTLIELLVVMLILGILAAIALPAFFNQKDKATDSKAKENAHSAQVAMETCGTEKPGGLYTTCATGTLDTIEPTLPSATGTENLTATPDASGEGYTVKVESSTGNAYSITRKDEGKLEYTCTVTSTNRGGCPGTGTAAGVWSE
jgi:type IV pilus assembly protein PilA